MKPKYHQNIENYMNMRMTLEREHGKRNIKIRKIMESTYEKMM